MFDEAVERYNVGKRKDRQITNYYEKIRQGKQEKLFHEVIFQIGNREDMAVGTDEGDLAVKVLNGYVKDFQKRNPTLRVFSCYLHQDEATPHLHIDFIPYVTDWKGKGMDTRVSLKQALKSLGFQGGNKHDTGLNQWINQMCIRDRRKTIRICTVFHIPCRLRVKYRTLPVRTCNSFTA